MALNPLLLTSIIDNALSEDLGCGDLTTDAIFKADDCCSGQIIVKAEGVLAGLTVAEQVLRRLDPDLSWEALCQDGAKVVPGMSVARFSGRTRAILSGERVALNFLQRMSGIATSTARYVEAVAGTGAAIADTRKTAPGLRVLDKYAVTCGGGRNHRLGLFDGVLIKDNHIAAAGGISRAVELARQHSPFTARIEVEVETLAQVYEALAAKADIIMLDNMSIELMAQAVRLIDGQAVTEASGGITLDNVHEVACCGVDFISVGALTHHVRSLDISLDVTAATIRNG